MKPIVFTARILPRPSARRELVQALVSWAEDVRQEPRVVSACIYEDVENPTALRAEVEWEDAQAMQDHMRSSLFGVLLGALELLAEPPKVSITTGAVGYETDPLGTIRKLRGGPRTADMGEAPGSHEGGKAQGRN